jgi:imidazolonepropionase-like amidohydrolase
MEGERIRCAGTSTVCKAPEGASVTDATGKWIIPGLIDTHVHLNWIQSRVLAEQAQAHRFAFGITTVREASTENVEENLAARQNAEAADLPTPRLVVSGRVSLANMRRYGVDDSRSLVRRLFELGVDAIKLKHERELEIGELRAVVEEAHSLKLPVYGHTWHGSLPQTFSPNAISAGIDGISHMATILAMSMRTDSQLPAAPTRDLDTWVWRKRLWLHTDQAKLNAAIDTLTAHDVWLEPILIDERFFTLPYPLPEDLAYFGDVTRLQDLIRNWLSIETARERDKRIRGEQLAEAYARMCDFIGRFHERGGMIVAGTDNVQPGPALHHELQLLTECGLSPIDALKTATSQAAVALRREKQIGTIEAGKLADLVILDADPLATLENLRRIWRLVKGSRMHDPEPLLSPIVEDYRARVRSAWARRTVLYLGPAALLFVAVLLGAKRAWRKF